MKLFKATAIIAFLMSISISYSQEWTKFHSEEGFEFYLKYTDCKFNDVQPQSWAIIKIENTNNFDAEVTFYYEQYLDGKCLGCGEYDYDEEKRKVVGIPKKTSKEGKCRADSRRGPLEVFHKFNLVKARELTDLKIKKFSFEKKKIK